MSKKNSKNPKIAPVQVDITEKTELELSYAINNLKRFDYIIVPIFAFIAALWAFFHIGISIEWDDLLYMNLSQYTTKQTWVLNRYGHIYLQKLFMFIFNDAITGAKAYWCVLYSASSILVYWTVKLLAPAKGYINAFLALGFFWCQPLFFRYAGCTFADLTVMFLLTLGSFLYLAFLNDNFKHRKFALLLIGFIFFWALKSKETGICLIVLFLSLGRNESGNFEFKRFTKDIKWTLIGILGASFVLMLLDFCFLKDFFFSIRPSSIRGLMSYNTGEFIHDQKNHSWYTNLSIGPISAVFLLYLFAGMKTAQNITSKNKLFAWLIPLGVIFFITAITLQIRASSTNRYIMPAIACMCIWAPLCFNIPLGGIVKFNKLGMRIPRIVIVLCILTITFVVAKLLTDNAVDMLANAGWKSTESLYNSTILPMATTILIACLIISRKHGFTTQAISLFCFFLIIYHPLNSNFVSLKNKSVAKKSQWRYQPYKIFADQLRFDKDVKILVSKDLHKRSWLLGRDDRSHCWMFNIFFNQKFEYEQFIDAEFNDITTAEYDFAFLTFNDWNKLTEKQLTAKLQQKYEIQSNNQIGIIFLKNR